MTATPSLLPVDVLPRLGLHPDLSIEAYHASPGVSNTGLGLMAKSMHHYYACCLDPRRPPQPERAGQLTGQLAHCAILEPAEFNKRYVVVPEDAPRRPSSAQWKAKNPSKESLAAMAFWDEFNHLHGDKRAISQEQWDAAHWQADSARALPDIAEALSAGRPEVSAFWEDPDTGLLCRCRPDWVHDPNPGAAVLLDVKTYDDASPGGFAFQAKRKGYYRQDAFYTDGYGLAAHIEVAAFVFVVVETEYPYAASAITLDDKAQKRGRAEYRRLLQGFHQCQQTGAYPGYTSEVALVSLPGFDRD